MREPTDLDHVRRRHPGAPERILPCLWPGLDWLLPHSAARGAVRTADETFCPGVEPAARASVSVQAYLGYGAALGEKYDCTTCGACCFGKRDYVQVFAHDAEVLGQARTAELVAPAVGEIPASVGRESEPKRFMKMTHGRCIALSTAIPNRFLCTIYEDRPVLCRALEPGSAACLEARARMKILSSEANREACLGSEEVGG